MIEEALRNLSKHSEISDKVLESAIQFYNQIIEPEIHVSKGWNFWGEKSSPEIELELSDDMALGFMLALSGAALCILPFGVTQAIGSSFIATGVGYIIQDGAKGNIPYYINRETGERIR